MANPLYKAGDLVVLKGGAFRSGEAGSECHVVAVLPEAYGVIQYRVQFDNENCERRITQADIESTVSRTPGVPSDPSFPPPGGSWIKPMTIRTKR